MYKLVWSLSKFWVETVKRSDTCKDWPKWEVNFQQMPLGLATAGPVLPTQHPWVWGEGTHPHAGSFPGNKRRKLSGCSLPLLTLLRQPAGSSSSLPLPPSCVLSWSPRRWHTYPQPRLVRHPAPCCALPFPPLAFSLCLQRLGRDGADSTLHPPSTSHTHHHPMMGGKESKTKTNKKIFCTEIYFYYTKFVQYQKRKKKRCKFFFIIVGKR